MAKIFHVYASNGPNVDAELDLPASDYELLDLMERLHLEPGKSPYLELLEYGEQYNYLEKCIHELPDLFQLNALAKKLLELTSVQDMAAFEGLVGKEIQANKLPIPLPQLIDFAYSTEGCVLAEEAMTDFQLGKFLVENDFLEEVNGLPESIIALLDFGKIGKEHREAEGGIFTGFGYVEQFPEVRNVNAAMDFQPQTPDYTILLEVSQGFFNDPGYDREKTVQLKLPATPEALDAALTALDVWDWREAGWRCLDCKVPSLMDAVSDEDSIHAVNDLAQRLADMEPKVLSTYKAVLPTADCKTVQQAEQLMDTLDQYILSPQYSSPIEVAKGELSLILCEPDAATLAPHLNLYQYGQALIEKCGGVLTPYGLIERSDGQPVQGMEESPQQGGMEMK